MSPNCPTLSLDITGRSAADGKTMTDFKHLWCESDGLCDWTQHRGKISQVGDNRDQTAPRLQPVVRSDLQTGFSGQRHEESSLLDYRLPTDKWAV